MTDKEMERLHAPLLAALDARLATGRVVLAIDGDSASGKSTVGGWLAARYGANLFHMDDYFLTPALRTPQRLAEWGGNLDYARFAAEVLAGLQSGEAFAYTPYNCHTEQMEPPVPVQPARVNVVEGVYSLHPVLRGAYTLKVRFCLRDDAEQRRRIIQRSGEALYERFERAWIPMERRYLDREPVDSLCQLVWDVMQEEYRAGGAAD